MAAPAPYDIQKVMKEELGVDMTCRILGACNPPPRASLCRPNPKNGLLLPCNATVRDEAGGDVSTGS